MNGTNRFSIFDLYLQPTLSPRQARPAECLLIDRTNFSRTSRVVSPAGGERREGNGRLAYRAGGQAILGAGMSGFPCSGVPRSACPLSFPASPQVTSPAPCRVVPVLDDSDTLGSVKRCKGACYFLISAADAGGLGARSEFQMSRMYNHVPFVCR
jgi:hypothetical protein